MTTLLQLPEDKIAEFCRRWKITEFALFGSVLRDDFRPDSDIDVLVSFAPDAEWSLFDLVKMQEELETLFQREVDLVEKAGLRNPFRRSEILRTCQVIYATEWSLLMPPLPPVKQNWHQERSPLRCLRLKNQILEVCPHSLLFQPQDANILG